MFGTLIISWPLDASGNPLVDPAYLLTDIAPEVQRTVDKAIRAGNRLVPCRHDDGSVVPEARIGVSWKYSQSHALV